MAQPQDFRSIMREVAEEYWPAELDIFDLESESLVMELYATSRIMKQRGSAEFAFADSATGILEFVGLPAGTFTALLKVVKDGKDVLGKPFKHDDFQRDLELIRLWPKVTDVIAAAKLQGVLGH